ncbi:transmembrane protein 200A-like [Lampetra planeri]
MSTAGGFLPESCPGQNNNNSSSSSNLSHHLAHSHDSEGGKYESVRLPLRQRAVRVRHRIEACFFSTGCATLGVTIVLIGITVTIIGYWPKYDHTATTNGSSILAESNNNNNNSSNNNSSSVNSSSINSSSSNSRGEGGSGVNDNTTGLEGQTRGSEVVGLLDQQLYLYVVKILGPLTMGIGIFVFICGIAALYENREKDIKGVTLRDIQLSEQKPHVQTSVSTSNLSRSFSSCYEQDTKSQEQPAEKPTPNFYMLFPWTASGMGSSEDSEREAAAQHHFKFLQAPFNTMLSTSLLIISEMCLGSPFKSKPSEKLEIFHGKSSLSSSITTLSLPIIKLNNCVIDDPEEPEAGADKLEGADPEAISVAGPEFPTAPRLQCSNTLSLPVGEDPLIESYEARSYMASLHNDAAAAAASSSACSSKAPGTAHLLLPAQQDLSPDLGRRSHTVTITVGHGKNFYGSSKNCARWTKGGGRVDAVDRLAVPEPKPKAQYTNKEKLLMISKFAHNSSFDDDPCDVPGSLEMDF